jgi:hypothetical protein
MSILTLKEKIHYNRLHRIYEEDQNRIYALFASLFEELYHSLINK